jgi:type VI secretion system secreted protein VgrG
MSTQADWTQAQHSLAITTPLGADKLILQRLRGFEGISECFSYGVEMFSGDKTLDLAKAIGKAVTVEVRMDDGKIRYINGVFSRFSLVHSDPAEDLALYEAEIRPWFWLLNYRGGFTVYQNKSAKEIIEEVLKAAGFSGSYKLNLSGTYEKREYCVQYNETDFAFLSRLMEEEGIYYWFDHQKDKHVLTVADESGAHVNCPILHKLGYQSHKQPLVDDDTITDCRFEHAVVPRGYSLDDFNFETPSTDLATTSSSSRASKTSYALSKTGLATYPGRYGKSTVGTQFAKMRLQAEEWPERLLTARGTCRSLIPGYKVEISGHARADVNGTWVVRDITVSGDAETFETTFTAFPADIQFRPPLTTPKPVIPSAQTAIVTGPDGEEIHTDKYGRVQVLFHWFGSDVTESCWIRVAHGWAGKSWGTLFLPRIGQEVVVSFLDGDPDRPLITGAVYNGENTPPYLPGEKTKSTIKSRSTTKGGTDNFNELRFEDKKGSEEIFLQAEKDMTAEIKNDLTHTVKNNETRTVEKDRKRTVKENETITVEKDRTRTTKGKETVTVEGDLSETFKGKQTVEVTGDATHTLKAKETRKVTGAAEHKYSANLSETVGGNYTLKVTGNLTIEASGNVTIKGTGVSIKASGSLSAQGASTTVKGSGTCETSSGGIMTVKGSMVKIN